MQRVRSRGSDVAVPACRCKAAVRELWKVVSVDQIMKRTRMLWICLKHFLENGSGLLLPREIGMGGKDIHSLVNREGIEDCGRFSSCHDTGCSYFWQKGLGFSQ